MSDNLLSLTTNDRGPVQQQEYNEVASEEPSATSSTNPSRPASLEGSQVLPQPSKRGRVRFNSRSEANDAENQKSSVPLRDNSHSPITTPLSLPQLIKHTSPSHSRSNSVTRLVRRTSDKEQTNPFKDPASDSVFKPRPSLIRNNSKNFSQELEDVDEHDEKHSSALAAQERAQKMAAHVGHSDPASRRNSFEDDEDSPYRTPPSGSYGYPVRIDDIPLMNMGGNRTLDGAGGYDSDEGYPEKPSGVQIPSATSEAHKLVRAHTRKHRTENESPTRQPAGLISGHVTPTGQLRDFEEYIPPPQQYRGGVLSDLLKLYNASQSDHSRTGSEFSAESPLYTGASTVSAASSGTTTPKSKHTKWYNHRSQAQDTLAALTEASVRLGAQGGVRTPQKKTRPGMGKRTGSGRILDSAMSKMAGKPRLEDEIRITVHIAETLSRQKFLLKLCWGLMAWGAPTHRLEEYMKMSARVLEIDGQFLYIPGCMIVSFDDVSTHTTEVKLVRVTQQVSLGKLKDIHEIYKEVLHDVIGVEEATQRIDALKTAKQKYHVWILVAVYGCASAAVGPFAFEARWIDLPIAWFLGTLLGFLQLIVAPRSELYSNIFEISAAVLTSFLARMFGSINGGTVFCFSALAQSSIALILPGYIVLCGALELQSRSMVSGAVRMVYAIIYSLFLGFGITIGTAFYGIMDKNASSATSCSAPMSQYVKWIFVPLFTLCLAVINQAKWKQIPAMLFISFGGYLVNFFSGKRFPSSPQISNTFGAFAVGVMGNLYSRLRHGVAAAAILPAIFVQVPSGIAAAGSLLQGISNADIISNTTLYTNGTMKSNASSVCGGGDGFGRQLSYDDGYECLLRHHPYILPYAEALTSGAASPGEDLNTIVFNVGYSMIQVAVGITVGLFLAALVVYPFGKRRSGLFSF